MFLPLPILPILPFLLPPAPSRLSCWFCRSAFLLLTCGYSRPGHSRWATDQIDGLRFAMNHLRNNAGRSWDPRPGISRSLICSRYPVASSCRITGPLARPQLARRSGSASDTAAHQRDRTAR